MPDYASLFAAADAKSSAAVSRVYGERLKLIPWTVGGEYVGTGQIDPTRESVEFNGALTGALGSQDTAGDRRGSDFVGRLLTRDRQVSVDFTDWPTHGRKGDRIQALAQPGAPIYEMMTDPISDGMNRFLIALVITK